MSEVLPAVPERSAGRCSVVLCTYNGSKYLWPQLESIAAQTRKPDELVLFDDASADDTWAILQSFAKAAPFQVYLRRHEKNLGSTANFSRGIASASGDWIALCDQDDVWRHDKLANLEASLSESHDVAFAYSDADCVTADLTPLGYSLWQAVGFDSAAREQSLRSGLFSLLLRRYVVTGATMAFRTKYRELVLPIPGRWVHDAWLAYLMSAVAESRFVAAPLMQYRQHSAQQIGAKPISFAHYVRGAMAADKSYFRNQAAMYTQAWRRLSRQSRFPPIPERLTQARQKARHQCLRYRLRLRGWMRWPTVYGEFARGHYSRFTPHPLALAQDLFV